ncbi:MAG: hypothetical protein JSS76_10440 [Bacteroidetes bacterium]|nr:hypothetical protein [Bacteroidota bacterium]
MKTCIHFRVILLLHILIFACQGHSYAFVNSVPEDTVYVHDTVYIANNYDWRGIFGFRHHNDELDSIEGHPVTYYTSDTLCSAFAVGFIYGDWRPSCDRMTDELLALSVRPAPKFHPFYVWCLFMTLRLSDACLAESVGQPARRYAETYPREFFTNIERSENADMYGVFKDCIRYSGDYVGEGSAKVMSAHIEASMLSHCSGCDSALRKRIHQFATDCSSIMLENK